MTKTKLNKAVALFCLTGFIFGGGAIIHPTQTFANEVLAEKDLDKMFPTGGGATAGDDTTKQGALSSAIIGTLPGIPIGSTVTYKWTPSGLGGYAVCAVSEKNPEVSQTQNAECFFGVPGGWAVPPVWSDSRHFEYGGSEVQSTKVMTFRWEGHHLSRGSVSAEIHNDVYQGTDGLSGGGIWGDSSWGDSNKYGWGGSDMGGNQTRTLSSGKTTYNGRENLSNFGDVNSETMKDHTGALDIKGGKGTLPWNDSTFNGDSGGGAFSDTINDALNDRGGSFKNGKSNGSYKPENSSGLDWNSSVGESAGSKNLDGYFNGNGYMGVDSSQNMPNGLTDDLFGFDTKPVNPPSWFDSSKFLDPNGNVKPEILKQMQDESFWLDGKEPGTINGQQMWDFYENAAGTTDISGGIYDQNKNPINGFYDAEGNPINVFFDADGNFVDAHGNPIKVYDRYGNEITGLFDKDGKRLNKDLFRDINGDGVVDMNDLMMQLAEKASLLAKLSNKDGLQSALDSIFGDDNSINKTTQGTLSIQDMYAIAKQILLNAGFDIDDIMNGRNYSKGSAYTDPSDAWDFNRITTLMKSRKITPVTQDEIREHQENRRKALAKKGVGGFGMPLTDPSIEQAAQQEIAEK